MGYERNQRGDWQSDQDYERGVYSSARDYAASGQYGDRQGRGRDREQGGRDYYGGRDQSYGGTYGSGNRDQGYGQRDSYGYDNRDLYGNRDAYGYGSRDHGRTRDYGRSDERYGSSYADRGGYQRGNYGRDRQRSYSGNPQGYDYEDRGFFDRAGDEVRSWFGDDEAERRREMDRRYDERYASDRDAHYSSWRRERIDELDRDYDEYRRENATKFNNEFNTFRTDRQTQRTSLSRAQEHMEVVGSDGEHVGTVDKVRGDRIVLTKNDVDAGGRHHSIPSRWIETVDDKVHIRKSASEAKSEWRDEERNQAMFGRDDHSSSTGGNLNRSFSGTY